MAFTGSNNRSVGVPDQIYGRSNLKGLNRLMGVFVGKVIDIADDGYQQHIWVDLVGSEVQRDKSNIEDRHKFHKVRQMSPFGGTVQNDMGSNNYGASWTPPAPGTEVLVAFTGMEQEGFLLGVLPDINRNAMQPGHPVSPDNQTGEIREGYDHHVNKSHDGTRQSHPVGRAIDQQGLFEDSLRGHGSSGARRESPSNVSGFNTPGGHSLVLDDGTVSLKKGTNFVPDPSREEGKNKLLRLRSSKGAQILMNDTDGAEMIYIINQSGTAWIEIDSDGNIDVFSNKNISMHAADTINFYAGAEFNIDAEDINIRARGSNGIKMEATTDQIQLHAKDDIKITANRNMHLRAGPHMRLTADLIDLNGTPAVAATKPTVGSLSVNRNVKESVANRVPEAEPWKGHKAQDSKVAAQAKSHPLDPDQTDYNLASGSSGPTSRGGGRGNNNPQRAAQVKSASEVSASIYSDSYIEQTVRNAQLPGEESTFTRQTSTSSPVSATDPTDPRGPSQTNVPTSESINNVDSSRNNKTINPRSNRQWDSDVGLDV